MRPDIRRSVTSVTAVGLAAILSKLAGGALPLAYADPSPTDPYATYKQRASVTLPVTSYDFTTSQPDFAGTLATGGQGRYARIAADTLGSSGTPVFNSTGYKILSDWHDSAGNPIIPTEPYLTPMPGDFAGSMSATTGGAVTNAASFNQWFKPVAGVNTTYHNTMALSRSGSTYSFDGTLDGFSDHNDFDYTAAIDTTFIHNASANYYLQFATDADVFVYIDGKLVIDGGGGLGEDPIDKGLVGGHFDVDVYNAPSTSQVYHKHLYDDTYDITWVDIANDPNLRYASICGANPHPLRIRFDNTDNGGAGTYSFAAGSVTAEDWIKNGFDRVITSGAALRQLRLDFRVLGLMAHTTPPLSHNDVATRAGAVRVRIYDTVTGLMIYSCTAYHHGTPPANYAALLASYKDGGTLGRAMPKMTERIDLSRIPWLQDGETHSIKVFFANRTGIPSRFNIDTNIDTLNLVALPATLIQKD